MEKLLICLPIRNEEEIIKKNVEVLIDFLEINKWDFYWNIILTINGSNDNSINIAKELSEKYNKINYLEIKEGGKGGAVKHCFDNDNDHDILMYMDVDLATSLDNLNDLIEPIIKENYDFVLGSRSLKASKVKRGLFRDTLSCLYIKLSKLFLNHKIKDLQCGFKAIEKEAYNTIRPYLKNNQWFFDTEWVTLALFFKLKIKEVPVDWMDNRYKKRKSTIKAFSVSWQFIINLVKLKLRMRKIKK